MSRTVLLLYTQFIVNNNKHNSRHNDEHAVFEREHCRKNFRQYLKISQVHLIPVGSFFFAYKYNPIILQHIVQWSGENKIKEKKYKCSQNILKRH